MKKSKFSHILFLFCVFFLISSSCGRIKNDTSVAKGSIVFINPPGIQKIDLSTLEVTTIYERVDNEILYGISPLDENNMIVSLNQGEVYTLYVVELNAGTKTEIGNGQWPQVIQSGNNIKIVYYTMTKQGHTLVLSNLENGKIGKTIWTLPLPSESRKRWQIDENTLVVDNMDQTVWFVDITSGKYQVKPYKTCYPEVWLSNTKQFICKNYKTKEWGLTDTDLKTFQTLKGFNNASPAFYEESIDTLFVQPHAFSLKRGEIYGMGVYDFKSKKVLEITDKMIDSNSFWIAQ